MGVYSKTFTQRGTKYKERSTKTPMGWMQSKLQIQKCSNIKIHTTHHLASRFNTKFRNSSGSETANMITQRHLEPGYIDINQNRAVFKRYDDVEFFFWCGVLEIETWGH